MKKRKVYLVLDNIRSQENVGSIFRTADGVGVAKIYLCGITPVPKMKHEVRSTNCELKNHNSEFRIHNSEILSIDKISKTALGAEKWVPWEYHAQTYRCLLKLKIKNEKLKILGLEQTKDSENLFSLAVDRSPLAVVVGNEVSGLSPKILKYCDKVIHIPMYGKKESLNVAVATGIVLYILKTKTYPI